MLDGLQSGKSIGQTLQGLGMSVADADKAQDAANKEIRAAGRTRPANTTKDSTKSN
jgi:hypothetical protein